MIKPPPPVSSLAKLAHPLTHSAPATLASPQLLKHTRRIPAPGPLQLSFSPRPGHTSPRFSPASLPHLLTTLQERVISLGQPPPTPHPSFSLLQHLSPSEHYKCVPHLSFQLEGQDVFTARNPSTVPSTRYLVGTQ